MNTSIEEFFNEVEKLCLKHLGGGSSWTLERDPEALGPRHDMQIHCVDLFDGYSMEKEISLEGHVPDPTKEVVLSEAENRLVESLRMELRKVEHLAKTLKSINKE